MNKQHNHAPAAQIEKHILENAGTSNWLRATFQLAIRRDPVDALADAELLAVALRARALETLSKDVPFNPKFTSLLLRQHADAIGHLANGCIGEGSLRALKGAIDDLAVFIHRVANNIHYSVEPDRPTHGEIASESVAD